MEALRVGRLALVARYRGFNRDRRRVVGQVSSSIDL